MIDITNCFERAMISSELGDYRQAIAHFTQAIVLNPDHAEAYYNRGVAFVWLDGKSEALRDFMRAKELGHPLAQKVLDACKQAFLATP